MALSVANVRAVESSRVSVGEGREGENGQDTRREPERILIVTGHGEIRVRPDEATVRLGVEAQAEEAEKVQEAVNRAMQNISREIKKTGVPGDSIQTTGLSLSPVYEQNTPDRETGQPKIVGYRGSNTIRVRITDLDLVGKVIDVSLNAGANRLEGVTFGLENEEEHQTRALQLAATNAQRKARALTQALHLRLGHLHKVMAGGSVPIAYQGETYGMARAMAAGTPTQVQPGEMEVQASITLEYEIMPE